MPFVPSTFATLLFVAGPTDPAVALGSGDPNATRSFAPTEAAPRKQPTAPSGDAPREAAPPSGDAPTDAAPPSADAPREAAPPSADAPTDAAPPSGPSGSPPSATPPSGSPPSGSPPSGSPPTPPSAAPPTDAAADAAGRVGDLAGDAGETTDAATPRNDLSARESDPPRHPIGTEWDDDEPRRTVTQVYHVPVRSPPPPPPPTEERDDGVRVSGYGGLALRGSTLNRNPSMWVGARGAILFGRRFAIGGAFYEATGRLGGPIVGSRGEHLGLRAAYGGLTADWAVWRRGIMTIGIETLMGAGAACVSRSTSYSDSNWRCIEAVRMFVFEPGVNVAFEVLGWLRLGTALGWRFVARQAWRPPNDFSLSGPYLSLNVDFGWFR